MGGAERSSGGTDLADTLARAIERRGVTLAWLRERLVASGNPVALATLSYWRSGRSQPRGAASVAAVEEVERLLDLAPGELTDHVTPTPLSPSVPPATGPPRAPDGAWEIGMATLDALDSTPYDRFHERSAHVEADIGPRGTPLRQRYRVLFQAVEGRVAEIPLVQVTDAVTDEAPAFVALRGCRVGRTLDHDSRRAFGAVLELDHPITPPETALVEFVVEDPPGSQEEMICSHATSRPHSEVLVWVRFDPADLPAWVEQFAVLGEEETTELVSLRGNAAHAAWHDTGPGEFGFRWGW